MSIVHSMKELIYDNMKWNLTVNGYYRNSKNVDLHRYMWEKYMYPIPNGYVVHHLDHNPMNNDLYNLCLMTDSDHKIYHNTTNPRSNFSFKGKKHNASTKMKMSIAHTGIKFSEKHKQNMCKRQDGDIWIASNGHTYRKINGKIEYVKKGDKSCL
jgi:hypothetical protein